MVLRLSSGVKPRGRIRLLAKNLGLDELLPQLEQTRSPDTRLTLREEQTLAVALDAALSRLPRKQCLAAHRLSVFPQPFTPEQAEAITGMDASTLEALLAPCVLRRIGERYIVPPDLRPLLARKLTPMQKERVHTRHRDYFLEYCAAISLLQHDALYKGFTAEKANLLQAVEQTLASPLTPQGLLFVYNVIFYLRTQDAPLCRYVCKQALPVLESALTSPENEIAREASHLIARILIHFEADFTRGAQYLARSAPYWTKDSVPFLMDWLLATHYMPNDTAFSMIYTVAEELLDTLDPPDRANLHCNMLTCLADRQTARGNYTEALDANVQALGFIESWDHLRDGILHALGKREEALSALDRALPIFKARGATHRVADCYQQIGAILGEMGMNGIARERIEEAISLYESIHSPHSRAGALRTLGHVYKRMGDRDTARALYEESLAIWKSVPHPEWIARLEKCLTELDA
jgi:tetratricopeptide (TPR) repeat protein